MYICPTCLSNPAFHCIFLIPPISVSLSVHFCPTLFLSFILNSTQQCVTMSVPVSLSISLHSLSVAYSSICFPFCPSLAWILKFLSLFPYGASLCLTSETHLYVYLHWERSTMYIRFRHALRRRHEVVDPEKIYLYMDCKRERRQGRPR